jgi:thiamine kinase-like enzyme
MTQTIDTLAPLAPAWLTEILRQNGHLKHGAVAEIFSQTFQSYFADFYRLEIKYSADAAPDLPARMILKIPFTEMPVSLDMGREEVAAYRKLFAAMPDPPLARCFDSFIDGETGRSHLLLEDLSATHLSNDTKDEISPRQWQRCVESLAELHGFWWESAWLGVEIGKLFDKAEIEIIKKLQEDALPKFFAVMGDELSPEWRKIFEKTLAFYPGFWRERLTTRRHNTLIHGDAHSWNFLFPKDAENGRAIIIDLATLRVRPPTNDLAYLMALKWRPDRRARLELPLLRHYHAALVSRGGQNYSWEDCLLDYRYSVLTHLFTPVVQCASGALSPGIWRANFSRIITAFQDHDCIKLI